MSFPKLPANVPGLGVRPADFLSGQREAEANIIKTGGLIAKPLLAVVLISSLLCLKVSPFNCLVKYETKCY
jgi:hypothetical protein